MVSLEQTLEGSSRPEPCDGEGRIMLPERLLSGASITDKTVFVGCGKTFQMWAPDAYDDYAVTAHTRAREARAVLHLQRPAGGDGDERR